MEQQWIERLREVQFRRNVQEELEFMKIVGTLEGGCNLKCARILMKTFVPAVHFDSQEAVLTVLGLMERPLALKAILEDLPRVLRLDVDFAVALLYHDVSDNPDLLLRMARDSSAEVRDAVVTVLQLPEVRESITSAGALEESLRDSA